MKKAMAFLSTMGLATAVFAAAEVGQPAPEFTATDINGKTVKLSDYKGKFVVLESYNLDCPFVQNHVKSGAMQELQKEVTAKGGAWLIVNSVNAKSKSYRAPEAAQKEWAEHKLAATAWLDDNSATIARTYGMKTTPHMFVIDPSGTLIYNGAIDDHPTTDQSDIANSKNYVSLALTEAMSGKPVADPATRPYGCSVKYKD